MLGAFILSGMFPILVFSVTILPELFSSLIPQKVAATLESLPSPILYPFITDSIKGRWIDHQVNWWTSGFLSSSSYLLLARQKCNSTRQNVDWLKLGRSSAAPLVNLDVNHGIGHDIGFISIPFVKEVILNPQNRTAIDIVNKFATMLAEKFDPIVGCIRSWDKGSPNSTTFTVIIDNMMNLELLFHSANLTKDSNLRQIAISHANVTMRNHIRADGSTWHVVDYNETTGKVIRKRTVQGYSADSTWTRGQAWALYGFANMYRYTGLPDYLETARKVATYFLNNIPSDGIIPWDFDAPLSNPPRAADSSAATIAASGLLSLSQVETDDTAKRNWIDSAILLLTNVTRYAWKPEWQSLLSNGTANKPAGSYATGIIFGDYYFIESGNYLISMDLVHCSADTVTVTSQGIGGQHQSSALNLRIPFHFSCRLLYFLYSLFGFSVLGFWY